MSQSNSYNEVLSIAAFEGTTRKRQLGEGEIIRMDPESHVTDVL